MVEPPVNNVVSVKIQSLPEQKLLLAENPRIKFPSEEVPSYEQVIKQKLDEAALAKKSQNLLPAPEPTVSEKILPLPEQKPGKSSKNKQRRPKVPTTEQPITTIVDEVPVVKSETKAVKTVKSKPSKNEEKSVITPKNNQNSQIDLAGELIRAKLILENAGRNGIEATRIALKNLGINGYEGMSGRLLETTKVRNTHQINLSRQHSRQANTQYKRFG